MILPIPCIFDPIVFSCSQLFQLFQNKIHLKQLEKEELVEKIRTKERESCTNFLTFESLFFFN